MVIFYDVAIGADSAGPLQSGDTNSTRYGIQAFAAGSSLIGKSILWWTVRIRKRAAPTGNVTAVIRRLSDDAVMATFNETIVASNLPTSYISFTFTLNTPYTIALGDSLLIQFNGANGIELELWTTDQVDTGNTRRTRYTVSSGYSSSATQDLAGQMSDGVLVTKTAIYKNKILSRVSLSRIYKNKILSRVSLSRIYKNQILTRVSLSRIYKNKILTRVTLTKVYKNKIVGRTSLTRVYKNKIISSTIPPTPTISQQGPTTKRKRTAWRNYITRLARDLKDLFKIKPTPPPPPEEEVEIPPAQPPQTVTILSGPPTEQTRLETINDKWTSVVASTPPPEPRTEVIYPVIINPSTSPLIQTKVSFPESQTTFQEYVPGYKVGEGSHLESQVIGLNKPQNRSKTASTINALMILLEVERQI